MFLTWILALLAIQPTSAPASEVPGEVPELVVAFLGDTEARAGFASALKLTAAEGAHVVMINGDFGYNSPATSWKRQVMSSIDPEKIWVIGSLGNHDVGEKNDYVSAFLSFRTPTNGLGKACTGVSGISQGHDIAIVDETCTFGNVSIISSGIGQVLGHSYLEDRLSAKLAAAPAGNWKLVGYHFTLQSMNPGIKTTESTARFFDLIRRSGAIGVQAHTHSVMASCPISSEFRSGSATPACHPEFTSLEERFVAPGTSVFMDSSLGGKEARGRGRCRRPDSADCKHLVDLVTAEGYTRTDGTTVKNLPEVGALFVVFNPGGDSKKARVYFKTVDGQKVFGFTISR